MTQHDKHQYYFEKYLRNDMPEDERAAFEQKLEEDASLRMAFEYYKLNRQKLLEQLIEEHRLTRKDNRFNKLIFLLISLTGIVLVASHFVNKPSNKDGQHADKQPNIIVRYIPFLNWENRAEKKGEEAPATKPVVSQPKVVEHEDSIETLEPSLDRNERLSSDEFKGDTFVTIWDKNFFEKWMVYKKQNDTLAADSLMKKAGFVKDKSRKLLVEFWESPVSYRGYLFNENKLVVYGLPYPTGIYMYKAQDTAVVVLPNGRFSLIDQPKFIRF
jgi:hypothetical protein